MYINANDLAQSMSKAELVQLTNDEARATEPMMKWCKQQSAMLAIWWTAICADVIPCLCNLPRPCCHLCVSILRDIICTVAA